MTDSFQPTEPINEEFASTNCLFCAKCYQTFGLPEPDPEHESESDAEHESDKEDPDDEIAPIFQADPADVEERIIEEIDDYVSENPLLLSRPTAEKELAQIVATSLFEEWLEEEICEETDLAEIKEWTKLMVAIYFEYGAAMPPRQGGQPAAFTPLRKASLKRKIVALDSIQTPAQRTQEWYETRYNLLTASNLWKALGTEAQQNQLIVEKCVPFDKFREDCQRQSSGSINSDNPMAWGQKYEPLTAILYQRRNSVVLGEYGCIVHPEYPFLGASPDGIVSTVESALYGRMVEIKNIVNREIDGVPSQAYWTQTQIQMEVCDLDECDFVETRFKEVTTKQEWDEAPNECKGVILVFVPRITIEQSFTSRPIVHSNIREYFVIDNGIAFDGISLDGIALDNWLSAKKAQHKDYVLSKCDYWVLDQYSCVLIKRNRVWFEAAIQKIEAIWRTIERERVTGCEHRMPKKRQPAAPGNTDKERVNVTKLDSPDKCLVVLQEDETNA